MNLFKNYNQILILSLISLIFLSFFLGFYFDENSAGAGGYKGDFSLNWGNLKIFLNNDLITAINYTDGRDPNNMYNSSRPPTVYILHKLFNPFLETENSFRRSVFLISLSSPFLFYFCLREKFKHVEKILLILISSIILLSPYYRTSAFWALDENYSFICILLSYYFLQKFLKKEHKSSYNIYFEIFLIILFSSLCIYFDQKLLIIPFICFLSIFLSNIKFRIKLFSFFCYIILSIPYIYFVVLWGGLIPLFSAEGREVGKLFFGNIGYTSTMIAFYLFPLLFFKKQNIATLIKNFLSNKKNYLFISLFFIYLIYLLLFYDFEGQMILGKGYVHKISLILFDNYLYQKIFTYFLFFISWLVILLFLENNLKDSLILIYFFLLFMISSWLLGGLPSRCLKGSLTLGFL